MKGVAFEWIVAIFGLFIVALIFILVNEAYVTGGIQAYGDDNIPVGDQTARTMYTIMDTIFTNYPLIIMFIFIILAIVIGQRRSAPFEQEAL